jgi:hypothetical protein
MQLFSGLNPWAVLLAAASSFVFGGVWYGALSRPWMEAAGLDERGDRGAGGPSPLPFVITLIAQVLMAWMLAGIILHLSRSGVPASIRNGLVSGFFIWFGFIATTQVVNHQFQMQKATLTLIDCGHWLGVMVIQGAILGGMAIR